MPIDYEMYVHVFRGASSGGSLAATMLCKWQRVRTRRNLVGEEAAQTLQNNFYVDDLLISVENEDMAVQLKVTSTRKLYFAIK